MTIRKKRLNKFSAKADSGFKTCFATKTVQSRDLMIRFVLGPDKMITPDVTGKLPGRGLWLLADPAVVPAQVYRGGESRQQQRPHAGHRRRCRPHPSPLPARRPLLHSPAPFALILPSSHRGFCQILPGIPVGKVRIILQYGKGYAIMLTTERPSRCTQRRGIRAISHLISMRKGW